MSRNPAYDKVMKARREADARMRAVERPGEPMKAQKETAGLANGEDATRARVGAKRELSRPTIASQGIDKTSPIRLACWAPFQTTNSNRRLPTRAMP